MDECNPEERHVSESLTSAIKSIFPLWRFCVTRTYDDCLSAREQLRRMAVSGFLTELRLHPDEIEKEIESRRRHMSFTIRCLRTIPPVILRSLA